MKYRKVIEVEAMQFIGHGSHADLFAWMAGHGLRVGALPMDSWWRQVIIADGLEWRLVIKTPDGETEAAPGDWIVRKPSGEFYAHKPEIFSATYEAI